MVVGIGEQTKGYCVYLPKDRKLITTQHVKNIEALDKEQNVNVQCLYLQDDSTEAEEEPKNEQTPSAGGAVAAGARGSTNHANCSLWTERMLQALVAR
ncbi:hypothetical protein PI124_g12486 [Phytophthora idaei]|nr:hypothetical protein PI125_g11491 [Phytophthora idaei]KAG3129385.1 hypothetical protein PI126_g20997 [Phytophthora idaei]KAG3242699.1 hypothetical protein PI124_g12486 [Phytophthora idaei]